MPVKLEDNEFFGRLALLFDKLGGPTKAAAVADMSKDQLFKWRAGTARPPFWPLAELCRAAGKSLDWLAFGEVEGQRQSQRQGESPPPPQALDSDVVLLPMLDVLASAGPGAQNGNPEIIARLPFSRTLLRKLGVSSEHAHFLTGRGDSMLPTIQDGQVLLVDASKTRPRDDGIYVIVIADDVRLKRIQRGSDGSITLLSDNRELYDPEKLSPADAESLIIAGKVFWKLGGEL